MTQKETQEPDLIKMEEQKLEKLIKQATTLKKQKQQIQNEINKISSIKLYKVTIRQKQFPYQHIHYEHHANNKNAEEKREQIQKVFPNYKTRIDETIIKLPNEKYRKPASIAEITQTLLTQEENPKQQNKEEKQKELQKIFSKLMNKRIKETREILNTKLFKTELLDDSNKSLKT